MIIIDLIPLRRQSSALDIIYSTIHFEVSMHMCDKHDNSNIIIYGMHL